MRANASCRWVHTHASIAALAVGGWWSSAGAQESITAESLTDEHVQKTIDAIVQELYTRKSPDRFWEPKTPPRGESIKQGGGYTALTVLALLYAGQSYQDSRLRDAVAYLEQLAMQGTYAVAVRANVWAMLPPKFNDLLIADTQWLIDGFSERAGGWTYQQQPNSRRRDNSITQYGALAWWEAAKRGARIERRYWQILEDRFLDMQQADGGWNYTGDGPATGSMTTAGLATLFITQDFLHADAAVELRSTSGSRNELAIARGLQWMQQNFSPTENPGRDQHFFYYLYGVERVGLASGYKYFGPHDWYRQAAAELLRRLCRWDPAKRMMTVHQKMGGKSRGAKVRVRHLAFGLLFLSRGRVPVAINKLHVPGMAWNNRPRDVANLSRWLTEKTETALNWQIVRIDTDPQDWLDAPVLYLASHERLPWLSGPEANAHHDVQEDRIEPLEKLKRYLDLGGLLFAVNEGPARAFAKSIEQAGKQMYPQYDWRTLPNDHWAYTILLPVGGKRPALRGLSNGVRELIIASRTDFSRRFQVRGAKDDSAYLTAGNIYFYASEMNRPRPRLARHFLSPSRFSRERVGVRVQTNNQQPTIRISIVRAQHQGNWKPEPQALPVFATFLAQQRQINVNIIDHLLSEIHQLTPRPTLVIVNGIDAHDFTAEQQTAIGAYVEAGGVILFETPGGRGDFTLSAEQTCTEIFRALAEPILPLLHSRIITGNDLPGAKRLSRLDYRPFALEVFAARETTPRLRGMLIDGQPRVLFSRQDISHGLLDQPCWDIAGYTTDSARNLLANIVQHAISLSGRY
ncbi:MAG: DUF4159 domain-containing protein [Planctomycetota bacterium]|nr:DUF4159 domain-containing protein [Planctomycetota bacterium]